jgi:hypothetical protein
MATIHRSRQLVFGSSDTAPTPLPVPRPGRLSRRDGPGQRWPQAIAPRRTAPLRRPSRRGRSRTNEGQRCPDTPVTQQHRLPRQRRSGVTTGARRAGPREHGRQAARSERKRPERAREPHNGPGHVRAAAGGALDPLEAVSATHRL